MEIKSRTEVGLVREQNEDCVYINGNRGLLMVADGMGGHLAGEVASSLAIQVMDQTLSTSLMDPQQEPKYALLQAVQEANREIYLYAANHPECHGMGTTLTSALVYQNYVYIAHVGDSRAYLIQGSSIRQLTEDHSVVAELLRWGAISPEEAEHHPYRSVLTRCLGIEMNVKVDLFEEIFQSGNYLLLCSDGLTNLVANAEILQVIQQALNLEHALDQLVELGLSRGGHDNITIALAQLNFRGEIS